MPQLTDVRQAIRDAFSGLDVPVGTVFIDGPPDPFEGQPWEAVPRDVLEREPIMFTFEGYQYYLPAFLLAALDGGGVEKVMASLCPPLAERSKWWKLFLCDNGRLTVNQSKSIFLFLKYIEENEPDYAEDARLAIDNYWSRAAAGNPITLTDLVARGLVAEEPPRAANVSSVRPSSALLNEASISDPERRPHREDEPPEDFF